MISSNLRPDARGIGFVPGVIGVVALFALSVWIQVARDRRYPEQALESRLLYVQSGRVMEKLALSYDSLLADAYWIRAIQHYGGDRLSQRQRRYELLYPLLDVTTSLDPRLTIAYRFGAIFLADPYPSGAGRPDLAIALLEKGRRAEPTKWEYLQDIGFVHYWQLGDYETAARWLTRAADVPGAPWWLRSFAAVLLAQGGDRAASRFLWRQILESADDNEWLRGNAQLRLTQLDAMDDIDELQAVLQRFERATGRKAQSWAPLVGAGYLRAIPRDPAGVPYEISSSDGSVILSARSPLFPLPHEPAARAPRMDSGVGPLGPPRSAAGSEGRPDGA